MSFLHYKQLDAMDCGATCLRMLAKHYGKTLKFSQEMTGTAEIITDDIRLLERFFNALKSIWKKNVE